MVREGYEFGEERVEMRVGRKGFKYGERQVFRYVCEEEREEICMLE